MRKIGGAASSGSGHLRPDQLYEWVMNDVMRAMEPQFEMDAIDPEIVASLSRNWREEVNGLLSYPLPHPDAASRLITDDPSLSRLLPPQAQTRPTHTFYPPLPPHAAPASSTLPPRPPSFAFGQGGTLPTAPYSSLPPPSTYMPAPQSISTTQATATSFGAGVGGANFPSLTGPPQPKVRRVDVPPLPPPPPPLPQIPSLPTDAPPPPPPTNDDAPKSLLSLIDELDEEFSDDEDDGDGDDDLGLLGVDDEEDGDEEDGDEEVGDEEDGDSDGFGEDLGSDDDGEEQVGHLTIADVRNIMACTSSKVRKLKSGMRWDMVVKNAVLSVDRRDFAIKEGRVRFEWKRQ